MISVSEYFKYVELEDRLDSFRLLDLHPGQADDLIHCTLRHERLEGEPNLDYRALSYAWGSPELNHSININGSLLKVTANLHEALHGLRDSSKILTLWADAICINQDQISEKNKQVRHMQKVYARSSKVIVWLGQASEDSDRAIAFIKTVCARLSENGIVPEANLDPAKYVASDFEEALGAFLGHEFEEHWESVARLVMRPWWSRAWIVQELVSAKTAKFRCGGASIHWPPLSLIIALLAHCDMGVTRFPHPFRASCAMDRAWSMMYINHEFANKGEISLLRLLDHRRRDCLDPRDKIYSILGMTDDAIRTRVVPNYAKPVADVWASALAADIEENQDLEVLSFVDHDTTPTEYPSWVADLTRAPHTWRFFKYWPPPPVYRWTNASTISFSEDFRSLHVDGFLVDMIEDANVQCSDEPLRRRASGAPGDWTWNPDQMVEKLSSGGPLRTFQGIQSSQSPQALRRSVQRVLFETLVSGQLSTSTGWVKHNVRYADEPIQATEATVTTTAQVLDIEPSSTGGPQLIFADSRHIGLAPSSGAKGSPLEPVTVLERGPKDKPLDWENILMQAMNQTLGRTVLLSENRHLGIGPRIAKPGDCIFVLFGLREAAILRPREDGSYTFVGTAWIHSFMEGQSRGDFEMGSFEQLRVVVR